MTLTAASTRLLVLALCLVSVLVAAGNASAVIFSNTNTISITDAPPKPTAATPYPSVIAVSTVTGTVTDVNVTLNGLTHAAPDDLDILLVGPTGVKMILMSDAGDTFPVSSAINLTFDDEAAGSLPDSTVLAAGTFRPTNHGTTGTQDPFCTGEPDPDTFPAPAPGPTYSSALSAFDAQNPNGTWSLYVVDDCPGGFGSFAGGWSIDFTVAATAVSMRYLRAQATHAGTVVTWRTATEIDTLGFNVYREVHGRRV